MSIGYATIAHNLKAQDQGILMQCTIVVASVQVMPQVPVTRVQTAFL